MGAKPPPMFCLNWPWSPQNPNNNHCNFDVPWLFKSMQTLGILAFSALDSASKTVNLSIKTFQNPNQIIKTSNPTPNKKLSSKEQGEAELRALSLALASGKEATVLEFYSPKCRLCNSLLNFVTEIEARNSEWLNVVMADAENEQWLPEEYNRESIGWIKKIQESSLLSDKEDKRGRAIAKTGVPTSRMHVVAGFSHLIKLKRPRNIKDKIAS